MVVLSIVEKSSPHGFCLRRCIIFQPSICVFRFVNLRLVWSPLKKWVDKLKMILFKKL